MNDNAMRDPATANCRIYVGNLKENTAKQELQNIFSKYGMIRGVMVSRNFGFIQFDNEASANKAIESENQKMYNGRKIAVSKVQKKNTNNSNNANNTNNTSNTNSTNTNTNTNQQKSNNSDKGNIGGNAPPEINNQNAPASMGMNSNAPEPNINVNMNMNVPQPNNNNAPNNSNNMGNHQMRPQWRNNRNNNRNNNNNNNSGNEMNLHTDRERSPFDNRRDNDRWNQDGGNMNFNNFRNNNRNNNMKSNMGSNMGGNMNNKGMNNAGGPNFGNNSGSIGGLGGMGGGMGGNNNTNNSQPFGFPNANDKVKSVLNGGVLQGFASASEIRAKHPNANDCEIVVLEKHLVDYAEFIENRLKRAGLTADLLFPNADLTIGKMLTNISNRGSLFAIIIQPQHKENKSVTLNILYGIPAEHRNMPLDDAISLIFRNYQQLCQGESGDIIGDSEESQYAAIPMASTRHPDSTQHLINLLADNRTLTVLQLDCLIRYLQERRELQYKFELGDTSVDGQSSADRKSAASPNYEPDGSAAQMTAAQELQAAKADAEEEIQKKIMEILSKPTISNIKPETTVKSTPEKKQTNASSEAASNRRQEPNQPNLLAKDPKLRNVLDSLMLDDI